MDLFLELFITVSLSFMLTFLFSKLVPVDPMPGDLGAPESRSEPESCFMSLINSAEIESLDDEQRFLRGRARGNQEEEEEMISGESIEVRRFQMMPSIKYIKFEGCATEESKRPVEFHRELMVCDVNDEYFEDEFLERSGFGKRACETEIESVEEIEVVEEEEGDDAKGEDPNCDMGDWEAIEREDFEDLICNTEE